MPDGGAPIYKASKWGEEFAALPYDEVLGAGSAGPGKTTVLIMEPLAQMVMEDQRTRDPNHPYALPPGGSVGWALHLRRTLPMLEQTLVRAQRIFPQIDPGAEWMASTLTWRFSSGYRYQFGHCAERDSWDRYMSNEYCMAAGNRIRMADGSLKAIERVQVGDMVDTLEGPRRVSATHDTGLKPCVRATIEYQGVTVGTQTHPTTHPVLLWTNDGLRSSPSPGCTHSEGRERPHGWTWQDFESLLCGRPESPVKRVSLAAAEISGAGSCDRLPRGWQHQRVSVPVVLHGPALRSALESQLKSTESFHCDTTPERLAKTHLALRLLSRVRHWGPPQAGANAWQASDRIEETCACDDEGELTGSEIAIDSQGRCSLCLRLRGGRLLRPKAFARESAPLQADAVGGSHSASSVGVRVEIQECTQNAPSSYPHFYSGAGRVRTAGAHKGLMHQEYVGQLRTFDLTVEGANHYIGEFGVVSSQTIICWDELVQFYEEQYRQICTRLRSSDPLLAKMLKIRAMSNPMMKRQAGENFAVDDPQWVKRYFVDPAPRGKVVLSRMVELQSGEKVKRTRMYYPATLYDNPDKDFVRQYDIQLASAPMHIQQALRFGEWNITEGSFFGADWRPQLHVCEPFEIPPNWPMFRSMDWGHKTPGNVHWWAMDDEDNIYCVREMRFQDKTDMDVAKAVRSVEKGMGLWKDQRSTITGPADTQLWEMRGDSLKSKAQVFQEMGVPWRQADKRSRQRNAELVTKRLRDHREGTATPGIVFFSTCRYAITGVPGIQTSLSNSEEPMKGGDDHAYDSVSYACAYASHGRAGLGDRRTDDEERYEDELEERVQRGRYGYGGMV